MKRQLLKLIIFFSLLSLPGQLLAEQVDITVKGMVCSFCAQGIKKTFGRDSRIEDVRVDLDNKLVTLAIKEGSSILDIEIEQIIKDVGYDVLEIKRTIGQSSAGEKN